MSYDDNYLREAIEQACKYDGYVDNNHYYTLMKYARIGGSMGAEARDALATAKKNGYTAFRGVTNRDYDEDVYARLGCPKYW